MIEAVSAVFLLGLFSIWKRDNMFNTVLKFVMLLLGLALTFEAMREFGFIVQLPNL